MSLDLGAPAEVELGRSIMVRSTHKNEGRAKCGIRLWREYHVTSFITPSWKRGSKSSDYFGKIHTLDRIMNTLHKRYVDDMHVHFRILFA
eukprot:117643-Amorphochlora_amoeboformis.AAC.1